MPAIPPHKTPVSDGSWDGPANEARLKTGQDYGYYRKAFAWRDPDGDESTKAAYRFIHHEVSGDGDPGAANITACRTGIAVLNGARGGTTIPSADRQGVYRHLAQHILDAGEEPPELKQEMDYEIRSFELKNIKANGEPEGAFEGYASTFGNVDSYGDTIAPGAFDATLARGSERPLLWCHDPAEPIGKVALEADGEGLYCRGTLLMSLQRAREVHELMKAGIARGLSIGFYVRKWQEMHTGRVLQEVDIVEVSATPFPANPLATIESVRAARAAQAAEGGPQHQIAAPAILAGKSKEEATHMTEQIAALEHRIQAVTAQVQSEVKTLGSAQSETIQKLTELSQQLGEMRKQVDQIDIRTQGAPVRRQSGGLNLRENESVARLLRDRRGIAAITVKAADLLETRTTIQSSGIEVMPERIGGVVPEARRTLRVRNLLTTIPTSSNAIEFVKIASHAKVVSPQTETQAKAENEITFSTESATVQTIATWIPATKQILEDFDGLEAIIRTALLYALEEEFEDQLLLGSGVSPNLDGLVTQATAFNTALLGTSWNYADVIGRAIQQIAAANEVSPSFVALNTADAWSLRLMKDGYGQYIFGSPSQGGVSQIFGLDMVVTNAMTSGQFLVGSAAPNVAQIRMRSDASVEISTEHSDYFIKNMVAIRAELRAALVVLRPNAFVKGSVTKSPA